MIYFSSDHHWNHTNIIKYAKRPFNSPEEMDIIMINRWNAKISRNDTVYYLGDITLTSDTEYIRWLFSSLNGHVKFIAGNHDYWIDETKIIPSTKSGVVQFIEPLYNLYVDHPTLNTPKGHLPIVLCHYSIRNWDRAHYGSWHLWGHSHGALDGYGKSFDVGVDTNDFYPYSFDDIHTKMGSLSPVFDVSKKKEWN